jgi:tripartite-type tricarboxylate transporter receptor subunit TctC
VVKAAKDGYTLVLTNNAAVVFRAIMDPKSASYDPFKDLAPLGLAMRSPSILAAGADAPFRNFSEMIAYAKANPARCASVPRASARSATSACRPSMRSPARASSWCRTPAPRRR